MSCEVCEVILCTKPRLQYHGMVESCFELYHTMGTDELILLYGATCKLTNHEKISLGFDLVEKEMLDDKAQRKMQLGVTMNEKRAAARTAQQNDANEGQAQVRAQTVATAEFTPVQNTKRRGRPRNTEKSKRTKRKSRAISLNYEVEETQITEETL